jgi:hypothetical protein
MARQSCVAPNRISRMRAPRRGSQLVRSARRRWSETEAADSQGCDRPPDWPDAHHIQHWADGGKAEMENLVLLCQRHHRLVHEEGWQLIWTQDRELAAVPP